MTSPYPAANSLKKAKNLGDVADASAARTNLGLGSSATVDTGTDVGDIPVLVDVGGGTAGLPAVDGSNLTNVTVSGVVSVTDVADGEVYQRDGAGVTGVALGTAATTAATDYAAVANNLSDLADAPTARGNLGLGALATGADATDVLYTPTTGGDWTDPDPTDAGGALDDLASRLTAHEAATVDITDISDGDVYTRSGAGVAGTTLGDLATGTINDLTEDASPSGGNDFVVTWDASAGAHRKVQLNNLPGGGGGGGGIDNVVEDTTPQLGGDLDVNGNSIVSVSDGDVDIAPNGTGRLTVQSDIYTTGDIEFEGSTANDFETTLTVTDPTADRTVTLPDATGTVVTTGNADVGATTTSSADADHVLVDDGGVLKKITPANLGIPSGTMAYVNAYFAGAGDATDPSIGSSATVAFAYDTEVTDRGGNYDHTTGVFTAPADGDYIVSAQLNHSGNTKVRMRLEVDTGSGYAEYQSGTDAGQQPTENTACITAIIEMDSGDKLRFLAENLTATSARLRGTAFNTENMTWMNVRQLRS